jgi:hypothetical protein
VHFTRSKLKKFENHQSALYRKTNLHCCRSGTLFDPWIRDPGWVKNPDPGSGMNNPDHISESLETILWVKILKLFYAYSGSGMEKIQIRDPGWE